MPDHLSDGPRPPQRSRERRQVSQTELPQCSEGEFSTAKRRHAQILEALEGELSDPTPSCRCWHGQPWPLGTGTERSDGGGWACNCRAFGNARRTARCTTCRVRRTPPIRRSRSGDRRAGESAGVGGMFILLFARCARDADGADDLSAGLDQVGTSRPAKDKAPSASRVTGLLAGRLATARMSPAATALPPPTKTTSGICLRCGRSSASVLNSSELVPRGLVTAVDGYRVAVVIVRQHGSRRWERTKYTSKMGPETPARSCSMVQRTPHPTPSPRAAGARGIAP